jgi:hypothetical protein
MAKVARLYVMWIGNYDTGVGKQTRRARIGIKRLKVGFVYGVPLNRMVKPAPIATCHGRHLRYPTEDATASYLHQLHTFTEQSGQLSSVPKPVAGCPACSGSRSAATKPPHAAA